MIVSALQKLRLRLASSIDAFEVESHILTRLNRTAEPPAHALVLGRTSQGVRQLFELLGRRLTGCVVLLTLVDDEIPGWAEAPYEGEFLPRNATKSHGMSLSDVLHERPAGIFCLEFPAALFNGQDHRASYVQRGVSEEIRRMVCTTGLGKPATPAGRITLLVENGQDVLADDALFMCSRFGRHANCALVVAQPAPTPAGVDFQKTADFTVAVGGQPTAPGIVEPMLNLPAGSAIRLKPGQGWCLDRRDMKTSFFQLAQCERPK